MGNRIAHGNTTQFWEVGMRDIKESDWKIFRKLHPVALERFCEHVLAESQLLHRDTKQTAHERFIALHRLFYERNKEVARLFDDFRRSTALIQIATIKHRGLLTDEEFSNFSEETQSFVASVLEGWQK
jgi:hypothetical protein